MAGLDADKENVLHIELLGRLPRSMKKLLYLLALSRATAGTRFDLLTLKSKLEEFVGKEYQGSVIFIHLRSLTSTGLFSEETTRHVRDATYVLTNEGERAARQVLRLVAARDPRFDLLPPALNSAQGRLEQTKPLSGTATLAPLHRYRVITDHS